MKYPDRMSATDHADRWRCRNTDHDGNRCARPGTLGESTYGHGGADGNDDPRAYCALHFPPLPNVKTVASPPTGLGPELGKLRDDPLTWAKRILASPDYRLITGIEMAREALKMAPLEKREPGSDG